MENSLRRIVSVLSPVLIHILNQDMAFAGIAIIRTTLRGQDTFCTFTIRLAAINHFWGDCSWYISRDSCISRHGPRCSHRTRKDSRDDVKEKTISHGLCRHFAEGSPVVEGGHMSRGWWHALQALTSSGVMWAGLPRLSYFSSSFLIEMLKARNWPRSSALLVVRFVLGCKDTMITAVLYVYIPIKIEKAMLSRSSFHVPSLAGVRESALGSVGIIWNNWWTVRSCRMIARWTGNIVMEFMALYSNIVTCPLLDAARSAQAAHIINGIITDLSQTGR